MILFLTRINVHRLWPHGTRFQLLRSKIDQNALMRSLHQNCSKTIVPKGHRSNIIFKHAECNVKSFNCLRIFHTTPPNRIPPGVWLFLRPATNLAAILFGRKLRKWWRELPPERKNEYKEKIRKYRWNLVGILSMYALISWIYYKMHLKETPITGRLRYIAISEEQYQEVSDLEFKNLLKLYKRQILDQSHPICRRISNIATRVINANKDLPQIYGKQWSIVVVAEDGIENAFVLPNGQIFVFTGMLKLCDNDDQVGNVLAHEIAHCVLGHGAELLSHNQFVDMMLLSPIFMIWSIFPTDIIAALAHFLMSRLTNLTINLPYSRTLETEADLVGLQIASKACLDVREAVAFWLKMDLKERWLLSHLGLDYSTSDHIDYLSTHPKHEKRAEFLNSLIPEAIELRNKCNCWRLPRQDPRERVAKLIQHYEYINNPERNVIRIPVA